MDIDRLIQGIEVERASVEKRRNSAIEETKFLLATVAKEGRSGFTKEESARVAELRDSVERAEPELAEIDAKLATAREAKEQERKIEELQAQRTSTPVSRDLPKYDQVARVGQEERTYNPGKDRRGKQFLKDVVAQTLYRSLEAEQRLTQHMREERVERAQYLERAAGDSGSFAGLVVPQYLTDFYAQRVQALRPFADICNKHDLPDNGMTVNIGRVTTGTAVQNQTSEYATVNAGSIDDTLLSIAVQTAAGSQKLSRQAIERGQGVEDVTLNDLYRSYATNLDSTLVNQATNGLTNVAGSSVTVATASAEALYPKFAEASSLIEGTLLGAANPSHVVMHSRRWYWLQSKMVSTWPAFGQPGIAPQNVGDNNAVGYNQGIRGVLPNGLLVVVDNNIATNLGGGTNQDEIYVVPSDECHLWEDPNAPVFLRAEQPGATDLSVTLVLYGYFAYTFARYGSGAVQKITGAGLVTPSFT